MMKTRQYEDFNQVPHELFCLDPEINKNRVLAYFDPDYEGPTVVITGNKLLAVMPDVSEGLKLARHAMTTANNAVDVEIIPAEPAHKLEYASFESWKQENLYV